MAAPAAKGTRAVSQNNTHLATTGDVMAKSRPAVGWLVAGWSRSAPAASPGHDGAQGRGPGPASRARRGRGGGRPPPRTVPAAPPAAPAAPALVQHLCTAVSPIIVDHLQQFISRQDLCHRSAHVTSESCSLASSDHAGEVTHLEAVGGSDRCTCRREPVFSVRSQRCGCMAGSRRRRAWQSQPRRCSRVQVAASRGRRQHGQQHRRRSYKVCEHQQGRGHDLANTVQGIRQGRCVHSPRRQKPTLIRLASRFTATEARPGQGCQLRD